MITKYTKYYTCTLLQDVVLNASLATEGNMESLDYIPGSNFLGIVAAKIYSESADQAYDLIHSGQVCFGDGLIMHRDQPYYAMPNCFLQDKLKNDITNDPVYLDYAVNHKDGIRNKNGELLQLKQMRSGYISATGSVIENIPKSFSLKSAYDRASRRTDEGKMYGFEAIRAGSTFLFSIIYQDEAHIETVEGYLLGEKYIGKSRNAEYGAVKIDPKDNVTPPTQKDFEGYTIVYAASNLCFIDEETGQQTFKPSVEQLGLTRGKIIWDKSQIRTFSYSPWNSKRNASSMQRHCIKMGSIFYVENVENATEIPDTPPLVGEYINEGLGRLLYNPPFLAASTNTVQSGLTFTKVDLKKLCNQDSDHKEPQPISSKLGNFLLQKKKLHDDEQVLAKAIHKKMKKYAYPAEGKNKSELITKISSSQWGNVRAVATKFLTKKIDAKHQENIKVHGLWTAFELMLGFYTDGSPNAPYKTKSKDGLITTGRMAERLWTDRPLKDMAEILKCVKNMKISDENKLLFMVKLSSEMAKAVIEYKNKTERNGKVNA